MTNTGQYLGRFAPSPTGDLHFGSLVAAMASYCDAKHNGGQWLVRIDDIDPPRELSGAASAIINTLKLFGFRWDNEVVRQSDHATSYRAALDALSEANLLYCCSCSRRELAGSQSYPGLCVPKHLPNAQEAVQRRLKKSVANTSIRMRIDFSVQFNDRCHGLVNTDFTNAPNDPVLYRKDGLFAYALACAIDDAQGITHVVRGSDLLNASSHQIAVMQALNLAVPNYAHIPIARDSRGQKLSKQTHAAVLDPKNALALLGESWAFLGQDAFSFSTLGEFWNGAIPRWQLGKLCHVLDA